MPSCLVTAGITVAPQSHDIKIPEGCVVNIRGRLSLQPSAAGMSLPLPWALSPAGPIPPFLSLPRCSVLPILIPWAGQHLSAPQTPGAPGVLPLPPGPPPMTPRCGHPELPTPCPSYLIALQYNCPLHPPLPDSRVSAWLTPDPVC